MEQVQHYYWKKLNNYNTSCLHRKSQQHPLLHQWEPLESVLFISMKDPTNPLTLYQAGSCRASKYPK